MAAGVSAENILSNQLLSRVLAMCSENAAIGPLLESLFAVEGDEIYVRCQGEGEGEGEG